MPQVRTDATAMANMVLHINFSFSDGNQGDTVMMMSVVVDKAPSPAIARR